MDKKKLERARRKLAAATCDHMAERLVESTLGRHVLEVVGRGEALSLETLLASLEAEYDVSPSRRGNGSPELDIIGLSAEKAMDALTMEMAAWRTPDEPGTRKKVSR